MMTMHFSESAVRMNKRQQANVGMCCLDFIISEVSSYYPNEQVVILYAWSGMTVNC
jgi:hypothetical protein